MEIVYFRATRTHATQDSITYKRICTELLKVEHCLMWTHAADVDTVVMTKTRFYSGFLTEMNTDIYFCFEIIINVIQKLLNLHESF